MNLNIKTLKWPNGKETIYHVFDSRLVKDRRFIAVLYLQDKK